VRQQKMRRDERNQIGCGLPGLTESFSNYIPSIFKKPENIGFDWLGNKNLRASPSLPKQQLEPNFTFAIGNGFLVPNRVFFGAR
jgi:hypothetical protein